MWPIGVIVVGGAQFAHDAARVASNGGHRDELHHGDLFGGAHFGEVTKDKALSGREGVTLRTIQGSVGRTWAYSRSQGLTRDCHALDGRGQLDRPAAPG